MIGVVGRGRVESDFTAVGEISKITSGDGEET